MKITGPQIGPVAPAQLNKARKVASPAGADALQSADQVLLSSDVNAVEAARKAIAETPDIREERVEALKRQIAAGTYQAPARDVAAKMLAEAELARLGRK